jgi:hypothetical protein
MLWNLAASLLISALIGAAIAWHRKRWLAKHAADQKSPEPIIAAVSPISGAIIATGTEALADAGHLDGDGCGHFGDACHHDGTDY